MSRQSNNALRLSLAPQAEPRTKGINFVNAQLYTETKIAAHGWPAVVASLTPADQDALNSMVAVGWYSLELYARLIRAIDNVHGRGDFAHIVAMSRFGAERDFNIIHRVFLRFMNPVVLLEKSAELWHRFHDSGRWVIERPEPNHALGQLEDWGCADEALCTDVLAYLQRAFELAGARNARFTHPACRARGDRRCTFEGRWK
jgi:hypothetical protein